MFCLTCMYVHCMCVWSPHSQQRVSDSLELELWMIVSYYVGAWYQTWVHQLKFAL